MTSFGNRLKQVRIAVGMRQVEVAAALECAPTSLTNWENGKVQPSVGVLSKLCNVYNLSPLQLLSKKYDFADIVAIAGKPVEERSYEEQIALNFSGSILEAHLLNQKKEQDSKQEEQKKEQNFILKDFSMEAMLPERFCGTVSQDEVKKLVELYSANCEVNIDIEFAFNILTDENKTAFLAMLCGLLSEDDNILPLMDRMNVAAAYTTGRLATKNRAIKSKMHENKIPK